ncbi:MAG: DUF4965 domain-containing protein [Verrucomicrobiota bacterium]
MQIVTRSLLAAAWPILLAGAAILSGPAVHSAAFRPPAVPLVACDPYFSIWSFADRLTDDRPRHWTGAVHGLASLVRIDGKTYRLMGTEPRETPAATQVGLEVWPTRTVYDFQTDEVRLTLTFLTGLLPHDLEILARPVTYLTWEVRSIDGKEHAVAVYYDNTAELVVNQSTQSVIWSRDKIGSLSVLRMGSEEQPVLVKKGDNLRIDWGYLYAAAPEGPATRHAIGSQQKCRAGFAAAGLLPNTDDPRMPRAANDDPPVMAFSFDLGRVGSRTVSRYLILAYDDLFAIEYFRQHLRPYWRRHGADAAVLLQAAAQDYDSLRRRCQAFDEELMADLMKAGGEKYARLCALAYRQCLAANKLAADANGQPLLFPKENFSNGCIATVDVIYPMEPLFLLFSPALTKATLTPILDYASSGRWRFPFAPHDLGTYPKANGQVYGGGEKTEENQMPVEETGNMLLLLAALAKIEGNAEYVAQYWPVLEKWAAYLKSKGFDPENQLCTDDFAGHLAHNVNLSAKAILALGAYGALCEMRGDQDQAGAYHKLARELAGQWIQLAGDGDHYRLAFDKPGTWSQKYNLVWDKILGLGLFPAEVAQKEMAFYRKTQNRFGLPLDNRQAYTKLDWTLWTATLTGSPDDFEALLSPVYDFLNQTPDRVPMTDWYGTTSGQKAGFQARSVVGGVFIKMLFDPVLWKKWASRDTARLGPWAPLPRPAHVRVVVPTAQQETNVWRYTFAKPGGDWFKPDFDASAWKEGPAGFGARGTPGAVVRTEWKTADIWLRREFSLPPAAPGTRLLLRLHHDEEAEVYLNGIPSGTAAGYTTDYEESEMSPEARAGLQPGKNVLAVHCHQTAGGQYIDVGIVSLTTGK